MTKTIEELYAIREEKDYRLTRIAFIHLIEKLERVLTQEPNTAPFIWKLFQDVSALSSAQQGVAKEQFLEWAAESYDLQAHIVKVSGGDPEKAMEESERLHNLSHSSRPAQDV